MSRASVGQRRQVDQLLVAAGQTRLREVAPQRAVVLAGSPLLLALEQASGLSVGVVRHGRALVVRLLQLNLQAFGQLDVDLVAGVAEAAHKVAGAQHLHVVVGQVDVDEGEAGVQRDVEEEELGGRGGVEELGASGVLVEANAAVGLVLVDAGPELLALHTHVARVPLQEQGLDEQLAQLGSCGVRAKGHCWQQAGRRVQPLRLSEHVVVQVLAHAPRDHVHARRQRHHGHESPGHLQRTTCCLGGAN